MHGSTRIDENPFVYPLNLSKIKQLHTFEFVPISGLPQGYHCGPLRLKVGCYDVSHVNKSLKILSYTDDIEVYNELSNLPHGH